MSKIGEARDLLAQAIQDECADFRHSVDCLAERALELCRDSAGVNGLSTYWRGLHQQFEALSNNMEEKEKEVLASLAGKSKHQIQENLNPEQLERVKGAREEAA